MSEFYKMDPAAWDFGTAELSLEEEAAYLRIVNAIHKHKGPVPNNDRVLAGYYGISNKVTCFVYIDERLIEPV